MKFLGVPLPSIVIMVDTIQRMPHKVRTEYGDYNLTYGGDTIPEEFRHFMMGLFQGNGCDTQLWSIISSIVFPELRTQGFGIHSVNTFMTEIAYLVVFRYIDECEMIQSDDYMEATHSQIQLSI